MKTSTKIWLIVTIVSNVVLGFYMKPLLESISFKEGIVFNFSLDVIIGLIAFVLSNISSGIVFYRFLQTQPYSRQLFFVSAPPTITLTLALYFILNMNTQEQTGIAGVIKVALQINSVSEKVATYIWTGAVLLIYFIYLFITFKLMTKPINRLEEVTSSLGKGKFNGNMDLNGGVQFKQIEDNLQKINSIYKKNENIIKKTNQEYLKFIPKQFLKFLGKKNILDLELGNKVKKEATTLFCDIRNLRFLDSQINLEDNFNFINNYLKLISPIIRKNNGYVDKYLGDGILAVFIKPESAIECAHAIDREIKIKNSSKDRFSEVEVGIAIHTGDVVFGVVGDEDRKALTIISDSVNFTKKMQDVNKMFSTSIIFSNKTLEGFQNYELDYRYIGTLDFKDRNQRIPLFESLRGYQKKKKEQILSCKNTFEEGVKDFDRKEYENAKSNFEKVISACKNDEVTKMYISLCDKHIPQRITYD